jgi:flagellin-like protein
MQVTAREAVSPIIATLLLIAIAVAAGIIVYVYVNSLAGGLTSGGGQQVSEQLSLDAYNYGTIASGVTIAIRNSGSSSVTISSVFFDGSLVASFGSQVPGTCAAGGAAVASGATCTFSLTASPATVETATSGTTHVVKMVTATGGTSVFSITAGRSG